MKKSITTLILSLLVIYVNAHNNNNGKLRECEKNFRYITDKLVTNCDYECNNVGYSNQIINVNLKVPYHTGGRAGVEIVNNINKNFVKNNTYTNIIDNTYSNEGYVWKFTISVFEKMNLTLENCFSTMDCAHSNKYIINNLSITNFNNKQTFPFQLNNDRNVTIEYSIYI